jgi:hypothetical protein
MTRTMRYCFLPAMFAASVAVFAFSYATSPQAQTSTQTQTTKATTKATTQNSGHIKCGGDNLQCGSLAKVCNMRNGKCCCMDVPEPR